MSTNFTIGSDLREVRVYLDVERMQGGKMLAAQAATAVHASLIVVPLLSGAALMRMMEHDATQVDWVLFEYLIALECLGNNESRVEKVFASCIRCPVRAYGPRLPHRLSALPQVYAFVTASSRQRARLPPTHPAATVEKAEAQLRNLEIEPSDRLKKCTVKSLVDEISDMLYFDARDGAQAGGGGGGGELKEPEDEGPQNQNLVAEGIERLMELLKECDVDGDKRRVGQRRRPRVHASFSSQVKSWIISAIQDAVARAGMDWTTVHTAQKDGWFIVWSGKARQADFIIILFTPEVG